MQQASTMSILDILIVTLSEGTILLAEFEIEGSSKSSGS
jgi:hypothetical protein